MGEDVAWRDVGARFQNGVTVGQGDRWKTAEVMASHSGARSYGSVALVSVALGEGSCHAQQPWGRPMWPGALTAAPGPGEWRPERLLNIRGCTEQPHNRERVRRV